MSTTRRISVAPARVVLQGDLEILRVERVLAEIRRRLELAGEAEELERGLVGDDLLVLELAVGRLQVERRHWRRARHAEEEVGFERAGPDVVVVDAVEEDANLHPEGLARVGLGEGRSKGGALGVTGDAAVGRDGEIEGARLPLRVLRVLRVFRILGAGVARRVGPGGVVGRAGGGGLVGAALRGRGEGLAVTEVRAARGGEEPDHDREGDAEGVEEDRSSRRAPAHAAGC
ncbi:MAG: hypothetical protein QM820_08270 [Minicystis sp.]